MPLTFANLASDAVSALEVYKTARSSSPTGGIGATINIKTARPLDSEKERVASIGLKANYDAPTAACRTSSRAAATPEVSGIYSDSFADRTIGISLSASYSKRDSGSNKAYTPERLAHLRGQLHRLGCRCRKPATGTDPITNRPTGLYSTSVDMRYVTTGLQRERLNAKLFCNSRRART